MFLKYPSQHCFCMTVLKNQVMLGEVFWCSMYVRLFCFISYHVHFTETGHCCLPLYSGRVYLHLCRELPCALQHSFEPHSRSSSDLSDQVVSTRVSDTRQGVVLTQETHADHVAACGGSPGGSKGSLKFEVTVDRPAFLLTEIRDQSVMSLGFLISQLRTTPYVLTERVELCLGFIYTAADSLLQLQQQLCSVRHLVFSEEEACYSQH